MSHLPALIERKNPQGGEDECPPIVRIQKMIFDEGAALDASDIHIEPAEITTRVRYRIDGVLKQSLELPRWMHENLVVRIKILARMDISERRVPQDGHISAEESHAPDVRVSVLPTRWGEKIVMRLLRRGRVLMTLSQLGFRPGIDERLRALVRRPQGILLVVGPTGSGKTTTLYACINEIRNEPLNIVTIEDPIEYEVNGITQVQVHEKAGLSFPKALRAILRQDPDVILIGEIRDAETAITAFQAAMTGHLVLSTLHATDAISTLLRLSDLGIARNLIGSAVIGIVAQRLVRLNCASCADIEVPGAIYRERLAIDESYQSLLRHSAGCPNCRFSGTQGRTGLVELLEVRNAIRKMILTGTETELRQAAREDGFAGITEQAVRLVLEGRVSVREAYRTCYFGGES
jgi:type II secretory ATPase GspE/PulE/Tfp pilus assembly ATPase PilB-like protein